WRGGQGCAPSLPSEREGGRPGGAVRSVQGWAFARHPPPPHRYRQSEKGNAAGEAGENADRRPDHPALAVPPAAARFRERQREVARQRCRSVLESEFRVPVLALKVL